MKPLITLLLMISTIVVRAQLKNDEPGKGTRPLTGIWSLVSVENINADGSITLPYGEDPAGQLLLNADGVYAIQILKAGRPVVASNDKNQATPEENAALVRGNNAHFGTYSIDAQKQVITFNIQHAFYPNWEGTVQVRTYTLEGDLLSYVVTNTTNGGNVTAKVTWKRGDCVLTAHGFNPTVRTHLLN